MFLYKMNSSCESETMLALTLLPLISLAFLLLFMAQLLFLALLLFMALLLLPWICWSI